MGKKALVVVAVLGGVAGCSGGGIQEGAPPPSVGYVEPAGDAAFVKDASKASPHAR